MVWAQVKISKTIRATTVTLQIQPFEGRVTSMIQCGLRKGVAEARNVFQSPRLAGEKSLVPTGQLFLSLDLLTSMKMRREMKMALICCGAWETPIPMEQTRHSNLVLSVEFSKKLAC